MANQHTALNVTSRYEGFLLASICEEPGGMRLSVLSALARMNVDPWEEAARLAALTTADAQKTLVSTLNLFPGKRQRSAETELLAARLVALLPKGGENTAAKEPTITEGRTRRYGYWLMWLCFALAMSFLVPHQKGTTTAAGDPEFASKAVSAPEHSGVTSPSPDVNARAEPDKSRLPTAPSDGTTAP